MPNLDNTELSLAERVRSTSMGDSETYGRYALGILKHGTLKNANGDPILEHVPGLPVTVALTFGLFDSPRAFLVFQSVFFFLALYFFLIKAGSRFPAPVLVLTALIMALHPLMIKHFVAIMSDLLFSSVLLWIAVVLWKDNLGLRSFLYAGLLFGLATYIRESALPLMVAMGIGFLVKNRRKYSRPVIIMTCVFFVVLSPWIVRNYIETGRFIMLSTKGSRLFYLYSIPSTADVYKPFAIGEGHDYKNKLERANGAEGKRSSSWDGNDRDFNPVLNGIHNYISQPKEQAISAILKTIALLDKPPLLGRVRSQAAGVSISIFDACFYIFHFATILFGIVLAFRKRSNPFFYLPYLLVAQYLQALFFWSEPRYLMPFYPFLVVISLTWYWVKWHEERITSNTMVSSESKAVRRRFLVY